jgi:hypothetical protein
MHSSVHLLSKYEHKTWYKDVWPNLNHRHMWIIFSNAIHFTVLYNSFTTVTGYTFPHQQIIIIIIIIVISIITITQIFNWRSSTLHFMYLYQLTVTIVTTKEQFQTSMSHDSAYPTGWRGTNTLHITMTPVPYHQNVQSSLWCQNPKLKLNSYKNNTSTLYSGMWHHIQHYAASNFI